MYTPDSVHAVHNLYFDWAGWLSGGAAFPSDTQRAIAETVPRWRQDGFELQKIRVERDLAQILFKVGPRVSPSFFAARVKGRLQHALRRAETPVKFSRKVAVRTLGENTRETVQAYLDKQVRKEGFVDPRYIERMQHYTREIPVLNLEQPSETQSGRYWYNLHLVLVTEHRVRMVNDATLAAVRDTILDAFDARSVSVMPDHLHAALRGDMDRSPEEIALDALNRLSRALGRNRLWRNEYYVGTFSEYRLDMLRRRS